jgi:hypothetical protein
MSVLTNSERRTEAKTDADAKFDRDPATPTDNDSHEPACLDRSC